MHEVSPGIFQHDDPFITAKFDFLGRPVNYIVGFRGYENSTKDFARCIEQWMEQRLNTQKPLGLIHCPAVIVSKGCYAWRNSEPYQFNQNCMMGIGKDKTPLRLLILHLLYTLSIKIPCQPDYYGVRPNLHVYLQQMEPPIKVERSVGWLKNKDHHVK